MPDDFDNTNELTMQDDFRKYYLCFESALATCARDAATLEANAISELGDQLDEFIYLIHQVRFQTL